MITTGSECHRWHIMIMTYDDSSSSWWMSCSSPHRALFWHIDKFGNPTDEHSCQPNKKLDRTRRDALRRHASGNTYLTICRYGQRQCLAPVLCDLWKFVHVHLIHNPKSRRQACRSSREEDEFTLIVASSLAEARMSKVGWKITRFTVSRWPFNSNFSGGRGIHSPGERFSLVGPPVVTSWSASCNFNSRSITFFCRRMTEVHFFSNWSFFSGLSVGD